MTRAFSTNGYYTGQIYEAVDPSMGKTARHERRYVSMNASIDPEYDWDGSYFAFALKRRDGNGRIKNS